MNETLRAVVEGRRLSRHEAAVALCDLTSGSTPPEVMGAFLGALRARRETAEELAGFVEAARALAVPVEPFPGAIDVCGTGGDAAGTFNVSTTVAFVVAGAGVPVAKHGNRSVSSRSGSADVLEALGVRTDLDAAGARRSMVELGFGFFFAPAFHPAFKAVAGVRLALGTRTVFNLIGPLVNPAGVRRQLVGVSEAGALRTIAETLRATGSEEAMAVRSEDGLDELGISGESAVLHLRNGAIALRKVTPEDAGLSRAPRAALGGGSAAENACILQAILSGERGPRRDVVLLNAAAALVVAGRAGDLCEGTRLAAAAIDSGRAHSVLEKARAFR